MKKFTLYDRMNATINCLASPEWPRVRRARKAATSFETPEVAIPTETRTLAGRQIRIAEGGPEDAPLVVLLSPFPESILAFMGSWEALTEKLRVVAIDLPGFGGSVGDRHDMSPTALGESLAQIIEDLDLHDIHLVGPDVGMGAALTYALNPEHRLVSLVVGHGPGAPGEFKRGFLINMLSRFGVMRSMTAAFGAGPLIAYSSAIGAIRHRPNPIQVDDFKRSYEGRAGEVVHWFTNFADKNAELAARVGGIELPSIVFWGELDVLFDKSNAENLHAALPKSELRILPEAGHHAWSDQPELFAEMIIDWATGGHQSLVPSR